MQQSPTPNEAPSLFHKVASYSITAVVASFVLQFLYSKIRRNLPPDADRIIGYVPTIVILSAIPAGVIALCGIPKYGVKKLLWKGIVGVTVPIVLFVVSVRVIRNLRELSREQIRQIEESNKKAEPDVPANPVDAPRN